VISYLQMKNYNFCISATIFCNKVMVALNIKITFDELLINIFFRKFSNLFRIFSFYPIIWVIWGEVASCEI
jgi:hypothetical protein